MSPTVRKYERVFSLPSGFPHPSRGRVIIGRFILITQLSSEYRLINALPAGCDPSNCDYYLGIRTNDEDPEFLDFMMVGKAQGWIAIGFSLKPDMVCVMTS